MWRKSRRDTRQPFTDQDGLSLASFSLWMDGHMRGEVEDAFHMMTCAQEITFTSGTTDDLQADRQAACCHSNG